MGGVLAVLNVYRTMSAFIESDIEDRKSGVSGSTTDSDIIVNSSNVNQSNDDESNDNNNENQNNNVNSNGVNNELPEIKEEKENKNNNDLNDVNSSDSNDSIPIPNEYRGGSRITGLGKFRTDFEDLKMRNHTNYNYSDNIEYLDDMYITISKLRKKIHKIEGMEEHIQRTFTNLGNFQVHSVFESQFHKSKFSILNVLLNVWDEIIELDNLMKDFDNELDDNLEELDLKMDELQLTQDQKTDLRKIIRKIPFTTKLRDQNLKIVRKIKK